MGEGKDPRNFPVKKTRHWQIFTFSSVKNSKNLQHTSYAALLSFQGHHTDNVVNKLAIGTQGGQKLIRKSSGSLYKMMIKGKEKWRGGETEMQFSLDS